MVFKGKVELYAKRKSTMDSNIHKPYSLVFGQCSELLQIKMKQQSQWDYILLDQNAIALLEMINIVTFFFEDQNFLPLDLYQAKANIYVFCQDYMTDQDYL